MFRRYPHPLFRKQAVQERTIPVQGEKTVKDVKAAAAGEAEAQAKGYYPPLRLAQAYVPWQRYGPTFSPSEALEKGTLFPELYSPYPY